MSSPEPSTSVYGATWRSLYKLLLATSWPKIKVTADRFVFGCTFGTANPPAEAVLLMTAAEPDPALQVWGPIGFYERDESFTAKLTVYSDAGHKTWLAALSRVEELSGVIETAVHAAGIITNRQTMIPDLAPLMKSWEVARIIPEVYPADSGGFVGQATVYVRVDARIRPNNR